MKRITAVLVAAIAFSAMALSPLAPSVSAHTDACAGTGTMNTGSGFTDLIIDPVARTSGFVFSLTLGACASKSSLWMSGVMSGWCALSSGEGITDSGHRFSFINVGTLVLFTGEVDGAGAITMNALSGQSCVPLNGANGFLLTFAVEKRHCTLTKTKFSTTEPTTQLRVWAKVCA